MHTCSRHAAWDPHIQSGLRGTTSRVQESEREDSGLVAAEDVQGTPTQSHISPSTLVYEDKIRAGGAISGILLWFLTGRVLKVPSKHRKSG